jgi:PAS domain S-box-containing protein
MPTPENINDNLNSLRRKAEEKFSALSENPLAVSPEEIRSMIHELRVHQIELEMQNDNILTQQLELDAIRERYFDLYDQAPIGYVTISEKGLIQETNLMAASLLSTVRSDLIHQPFSFFILPEDQEIYYHYRNLLMKTGEPQVCDLRMRKKGGSTFWAHLSAAAFDNIHAAPTCRIVISDITQNKLDEIERELTSRLILMINSPGDFQTTISEMTGSLQKWSGCEAIGIRLREEDDFPYFETRGFPSAFVELEKYLCAYGPDGGILRDGTGNPVLECMCGNVLSGRFDPAKPFFSEHGSFWTNSTTALLASTTESDRQARTRNRCNGMGYESVALIPLRTGHQVFGLLQFNDHRPNCFSPERIAQFERVADNIALSLSHRQAVIEIQASKAKLDTALASTTDGIFITDAQGNIIELNEAFAVFHKFNSKRAYLDTLTQHPDFLDVFTMDGKPVPVDMRADSRALRGETGTNVEYSLHRKDTGETWVGSFSFAPIRGHGGSIIGSIVTARDITEKKLMELAYQENLQRLNFHIDNSPMATIEWSADYVVTRWAGAAEKMFGWTAAEAIGKRIMDLNIIYEDDIPLVQKTMERLSRGSEIYVVSANRNITQTGQIIFCEWYNSVLTDHTGKMMSVFSRVLDVTQRKEAEEALITERWKLQSIIEGAGCGTWEWNVQTGEVILNKRWAEIIGYTLDELSPVSIKTWEILGHPDDLKKSNRLLERHFAGELPYYDCECRMKHKNGQWIWIQDCGRVITRTKDGKPLMMFGTHTDISRRKTEESQFRQMQKSESLFRMAGAIAHHFNNQLYVVIGNLELLINSVSLGSDESERVIDAMKAAHKAADVSRLMLTYLGQTPPNPELLDLSEICHKGLLMVQALIPKHVSIEPEFPFPGPMIRANRGQVIQVISNLLTNSWEAVSDAQGSITITVKTVSPTDIPAVNRYPVEWHPGSHLYACLEVTDTGCGIDSKDFEILFDPFYTTKFTGRGLGLPVVLGIVSAHSGGITVESRPFRGSVFRIYFPLSEETAPASVQPVRSTIENEVSGTVLLIEDETQVRSMARIMLTRLGYTVLEAKDGTEALEFFQQRPHDIRLVLTDLTMPRMNGWETLTALRKISPDIPVILSSGYDEAQVMAEDHPDRPNAFLGKPYQLKTLRETIDRVLFPS